jgi:Cu(I)/Ag(I) efflux system membrane fusion protein
MKTAKGIIIGGVCGAIVTAIIYSQFLSSEKHETETTTSEPKPLYWVAPMDANFRKDQPGKSPMGMDLVPVYADTQGEDEAGVVRISPSVVNNLGVRTAKVQQQVLNVPIKTVGYVQYNENNLQHVHPRVEGWIDKLYIKAAGERVEKGEPLYALYSPELVNAQEEYLLAKKRNNQGLILAAESRLLALQMPAKSVQQLKTSQAVQQTIVFNAPQSGVIDNLAIREGFYVKPGTTLMSIGALDDVWVEAEVFERQAGQVKVGQKVDMTLGFVPGKTWQGEVDYVYPTLDAQTRTLRIRMRFVNADRLLKPNMFAQVIIHSNADKQSLLIAKEAVIRTGMQDRVVLVKGQGQFKSVQVTIGQVTNQYVEILDGLEVSDEVVISAQFLLDSESSINSDFMRMSSVSEDEHKMHTDAGESESAFADEDVNSASTFGVVNQINQQTGVANISRGPIEKWQRGPATMDFEFAQALLPINLQVQDNIDFTFEIRNGVFVITDYAAIAQEHNHD